MASETWQVDDRGLRPSDLAYLRALGTCRRGIAALTQMLPVGQDEILNVIEPYLLQLELIRTTGAGRELTEIGHRIYGGRRTFISRPVNSRQYACLAAGLDLPIWWTILWNTCILKLCT